MGKTDHVITKTKSGSVEVWMSTHARSIGQKCNLIASKGTYTFFASDVKRIKQIKGTLLGLRQFLATKSPLTIMRNAF